MAKYEDFDPKDNLRKELEDKIHKIDEKVGSKVSETTLLWLVGIVVVVCGYLFLTQQSFDERLSKAEQKIEDKTK